MHLRVAPLSLVFLLGVSVWAQETGAVIEHPHRMPGTTVTATRSEESYLEVPSSVTIADADEIQRRQSATPALMLREEPGVWVQRTGHAGGAPILRGRIGNQVLYLWDGIRINNGALFGGPNAFLNQIPPGAIDHIEVVRGPGSVQYGSDAVGGVINVLTRRVKDYPDEGVLYGGQTVTRYGSVDDLLASDTVAWVSVRHLSLLAGGGFQDFKDYEGGGGFGEVDDTKFDTDSFFGKLGWRLSEQHLVELSFQRMHRDDVHNYIQSKRNASGIPTLLTPDERRDLAKLSYEGHDLGRIVRSIDAYAYLQDVEQLQLRTTESATRFDRRETDSNQSMYGVGFQGITPVTLGREHKLTWGTDYRLEKLGNTVTIERTTKATGAVTRFKPQGNTPDGTYEVWDAFLIGEWSLRENLTLSTGLRYEVLHLDSEPTPLDTVTPFTLEQLDLNKWWQALTWQVGAVWWVRDDLALTANVAEAFRAPNFSDALSFSAPVFSSTTVSVPSPDVAPERAYSFEVGPRFTNDHLTATLTGWYTILEDQITSVNAGTISVPGIGDRTARANLNDGEGFVKGVDLSVEYRPIEGLTVFGGLSYAFGRDEFRDAPSRFVPPLNGSIGARYERTTPRPWWVEVNVRLVDRYTRHAPDDENDAAFATDPGLGSPNTTTNRPLRADFDLPGYAVVYLRGGVELYRRGSVHTDLTLSVENLLDRQYRETFSRQIVEPGANVVTALEVHF